MNITHNSKCSKFASMQYLKRKLVHTLTHFYRRKTPELIQGKLVTLKANFKKALEVYGQKERLLGVLALEIVRIGV